MAKTIGIGHQDFETVQKEDYFYIDKTNFIREWWDNGGQRDINYMSQTVWQNFKYEHAGKIFLCKLRRQGRLV